MPSRRGLLAWGLAVAGGLAPALGMLRRSGPEGDASMEPEHGAMEADEDAGWLDAETKVEEAPGAHGGDLRLWLRLFTCATLVENEVRRRLRQEFDFTLPRFDLLAQLERAEDGMVLGEISKRMMVSPGNLTDMVERMVEAGYVSRTPLASDRRVQIVALTVWGRGEFRRIADRHSEWIGKLFAGLPPAEGAALTAELGKLKQSIRAALGKAR